MRRAIVVIALMLTSVTAFMLPAQPVAAYNCFISGYGWNWASSFCHDTSPYANHRVRLTCQKPGALGVWYGPWVVAGYASGKTCPTGWTRYSQGYQLM